MLFKAFHIKNYKSFVESGKCSVQNGVTILAGQNESGKTNILTALTKINDKEPIFSVDEVSFNKPGVSPQIFYWFDLSDDEINAVQENFPSVSISREIMVEVANKKRIITSTISSSEEDCDTETITSKIAGFLQQFLPKLILYKTSTDELPNTFTSSDLSKISLKRLGNYLNADFAQIFSNSNQQAQKHATESLSRKISGDFSSKYKQKDVQLEFNINSSTISLYIHDKKSSTDERGYPFHISQRSTGLQWYLNFYIALKGENLSPGDIILVDEPGMYLHPKAQQEMREILNEESKNNQIIYSTHSPYLIDTDNISQIRLVEKRGMDEEFGYNEVSEIRERIHHGTNENTLKPIIDAIGYSIGSELNLTHKKILICEGVSDYYYIKALEQIMRVPLECGITHSYGCSNIQKINSVYLGLGISDIYALVDSDRAGLAERKKAVKDGIIDENHFLTTHGLKVSDKAIEDIFDRTWYLNEILEYNEEDIKNADKSLSNEIKSKHGGAKYIWAKKLFDKAMSGGLSPDIVLDQSGKDLFQNLCTTINGI